MRGILHAVVLALALGACGDAINEWPYHVEEAFLESCLSSAATDLGLETQVYCLCMTHEAQKLWAIEDITQAGIRFQTLVENGAHWVCQQRAKSATFDLAKK